jgi:tRNA threonylcarbamoyladenosine biosynthesis protein TsaE
MVIFEKKIENKSELLDAAKSLLFNAGNEKIICFNASMGAGKTTFIKSICEQLGYFETVSSPTYPIINLYQNEKIKIYHIDCYRLKDADEAIEIGMEDCFYSGNYCLIEWATVVKKILPLSRIEVSIEIVNENSRKIIAKKISN